MRARDTGRLPPARELFSRVRAHNHAGRLTFFEEMPTLEYLKSRPDRCFPIPAADAVAIGGVYPSRSCVRFDPRNQVFTVSRESFTFREASEPESVAGN